MNKYKLCCWTGNGLLVYSWSFMNYQELYSTDEYQEYVKTLYKK